MLSSARLMLVLPVLLGCLQRPAAAWNFPQEDRPRTDAADHLPPLTEDQRQAMQVINDRTVQATVSFLASDELGGRGTPSPGYTIACAYVASRLRAAGLEGGAADGTFFQKRELETIQLPRNGIELSLADGSTIPCLGLVAATDQPLQYTGAASQIDGWDTWDRWSDEQKGQLAGAVVIPAEGNQAAFAQLRQWTRRARALQQHGAQVLLLAVDPGDELVALSKQLSAGPRWTARRESAPLPILLIDRSMEVEGPLSIRVPAVIPGRQTVSNVIGKLVGSDPESSKEAVVISAHLDHLGIRDNGTEDSIYNGADDNASGVTGVLSLADAFGALQNRPSRTTLFVAFWGEEMGLMGSRDSVENPVWPLNKIVAMINLEMIGRPEPGANQKAWMTGWEQSSLGTVMAAGAARADVEVFEHPSYSSRLYRASDNWPFVQAGVIAHSFSAGSLHQDYHQPNDRWEKLEIRHMTRVIQGLFAGALPIVEGRLTPQKRAAD